MKFTRSLVTLTVGLGLAACQARKHAASELPPVAVRVVVTENNARPSSEEVVGTVAPKLRAAIEPKVSARIESLLVAPGQTVKAGDLIAQLDARELQARLDQAVAASDQATRDLTRARSLFQQKITTQSEFDAAQARERITAGALKEAETMLGYTKVVAPFDGIVTRKLADVGDLAAPGKPIVEMEDPSALRFEADVPEALIGNVKLGEKLPVRIDRVASEGTVVEMAPVADPASRTFLVKLDLPAIAGVRSGQFGRVLVPTGETKSIRLPASAVIVRGQMETVFVVVKNYAQLRIVRTGEHADGKVEILAGLDPGESVVVEGTDDVHDGQPVTIKP